MEKLLEHAASYEYEDNGRSPQHLPPREEGTTPYAIVDGGTVIFNHETSSVDPMDRDDHHPPPSLDKSSIANKKDEVKPDDGTNENGKSFSKMI